MTVGGVGSALRVVVLCWILFSTAALTRGDVVASPQGSMFNPNSAAFAGSAGSLVFTSGTLTFNTNTGAITGAPAGMNAGQNFYAVRSQSGGVELALFVFDAISLSQAVTINVVGDRGLVLASRGDFQLASALQLNGGNAPTQTAFSTGGAAGTGAPGSDSGTAGFAPASAPPGPTRGDGGRGGYGNTTSGPNLPKNGTGAGGGRIVSPSNPRPLGGPGAGYGGKGVGGISVSGQPYGQTTLADLFGGSGGAGALQSTSTNSAAPTNSAIGGGGGGGGAVELIALGTLTLSGSVEARGGNGGGSTLTTGNNAAGGGGSGGGVLVAANHVVFSGSVNVSGGDAGALAGGTKGEGGAGGGGRVAFYYNTLLAGSLATQVTVAGGSGGLSTAIDPKGSLYDAGAGSFPFQSVAGPELSSLTLACFAAAPLLLLGRGSRHALPPN